MVGYDPNHKRQLSQFDHGLAGFSSGVLTRAICQPLDVIKIRFQLQLEPISKKAAQSKYKGLLQAVRIIVTEERLGALWKGHVPAQLLSAVYGVSQFVTFEILTRQAWYLLPEKVNTDWRPSVHFVCGSLSGTLATCISQPLDTIRTRLVGQGEPKVYGGVVDAVRTMYRVEGARSLYRGLTPMLLQTAPNAGLQFGFYSLFVKIGRHMEMSSIPLVGWMKSMICGTLAGVFSKATVYPLDLAKKRLQVQGFDKARKSFGKVGSYKGLVDCLVTIIRHEGLPGIFKGFAPSLLKAAMTSGFSFCFYDQICEVLRTVDFTGHA